jgi:hypothetical protein
MHLQQITQLLLLAKTTKHGELFLDHTILKEENVLWLLTSLTLNQLLGTLASLLAKQARVLLLLKQIKETMFTLNIMETM